MNIQYDLSQYEKLPPILLNVGGNLVVKAWEQLTISGQTSDEDPTLALDETQVVIEANDDLMINLPMGCDLSIEVGGDAHIQRTGSNLEVSHVGGNLQISHVGGNLDIEEARNVESDHVGGDMRIRRAEAVISRKVGGNLAIEGAAAVEIDSVGGDLHLRQAETVTCRNVGGNAVVHGVNGSVAVSARGDLHVMDCSGDIAGDARGNAQIEVLAAAPNVRVNASGDIQCRLREEVGARVRAVSGGDLHVTGTEGHISAQGRGVHSFTVGSGDGSIALIAAGNVNITGAGPVSDPKSVTEAFSYVGPGTDFGQEMEKLGVELDKFGKEMAALGEDLGHEFGTLGEKIAEKINRKLRQKLERSLHRASARASRKAAAGARLWSPDFEPATPPRPPRPPAPVSGPQQEPVSEQERMMVLRMLEEGKITAAEAEKLLAALEGEYPES